MCGFSLPQVISVARPIPSRVHDGHQTELCRTMQGIVVYLVVYARNYEDDSH